MTTSHSCSSESSPPRSIYLDNNATTPLDPRVFHAMYHGPFLPKNPSSIHFFGQKAKAELYEARRTIAEYLNVSTPEIIFTSGGTEAVNLAIWGSLSKGHIISTDIEHSCVYETLLLLQKKGYDVTFLKVNEKGNVDPNDVQNAIKENTKLIVVSYVNAETGVKNDIDTLAMIAQEKNISFIVDGVALLGKENFEIPEGVSAMCFSGHKLHAPRGTGFAFIRSGFQITPLFKGGNQEFQKRAGTENFEGILGLSKAVKLLEEELPEKSQLIRTLRDRLEKNIQEGFSDLLINGSNNRVCNVSNIAFPGVDGENLLIHLDQQGVFVSHGSACLSGALEPSRVLTNMGLDRNRVNSSLRFSLSRFNTKEEIDKASQIILDLIKKLS